MRYRGGEVHDDWARRGRSVVVFRSNQPTGQGAKVGGRAGGLQLAGKGTKCGLEFGGLQDGSRTGSPARLGSELSLLGFPAFLFQRARHWDNAAHDLGGDRPIYSGRLPG